MIKTHMITPLILSFHFSNRISSRLKMEDLMMFEIPESIRNIECYEEQTKLDDLKRTVQEARDSENAYVEAFTAMIQLEEAAASKHLQMFDLESVKLELHSRKDQVFRLKFDVSFTLSMVLK